MAHKNILKLAKSEFLKPKNRRLRNGLIVLLCLIIFADIAFPNSVGWTRLVLNTLGYAGLLLVYVYSGLNLSDLGLSLKNIKRGVFFGFVISLIIMIGYSIVFMIQPNLFHDSRYHQNLWSAFFAVLILLPLKTVLLEELIFRGILPGILTKMYNPKVALYGSAILFGLWHIMPSLHVRSFPVGNFRIR